MGERIDITVDEMDALEALVHLSTPPALIMNRLAARGLVWRTGATWTLSQAGWRSIRRPRLGARANTGLDARRPGGF